jgi:hypothetical protein
MVTARVGYRLPMSTDGTDQNGELDDAQEQAATSDDTGAAAQGEYDARQGSPDSGAHPVSETYPEGVTPESGPS